jgi:hypothetical protein
MYIPTRLQQKFELKDTKLGTNIIINGNIVCCGQHDFKISYSGMLKKSLIGRMGIFPIESELVLLAKCSVCGEEIQVYNNRTDGYDNCFKVTPPKPLLVLNDLFCSNCHEEYYSIEITFEYQSKEDLENDGVKDFQNAFSWIWITLKCSTCNRIFKNIVDIETA